MSHRIEVLENNTIEIFNGEADVPFLRQPHWPNGAAWETREQAQAWAEMFVEAIEVAEAPFAPAGPGMERQPKPTAEQIAEWEAARLAQQNPPAPQNP